MFSRTLSIKTIVYISDLNYYYFISFPIFYRNYLTSFTNLFSTGDRCLMGIGYEDPYPIPKMKLQLRTINVYKNIVFGKLSGVWFSF